MNKQKKIDNRQLEALQILSLLTKIEEMTKDRKVLWTTSTTKQCDNVVFVELQLADVEPSAKIAESG